MFHLFPQRQVQRKFNEKNAEQLLAVFTGRGRPNECQEAFGWLMMELKLWGKLESEEDVVLHNKAVEILSLMGLQDITALKKGAAIRFEINFPEPEEYRAGVHDTQPT
jgi:hypothetical protein